MEFNQRELGLLLESALEFLGINHPSQAWKYERVSYF